MIVNRYTILTPTSSDTGYTINIPISQEFQVVDYSDDIESVFVSEAIEEAINPAIDYERVKFNPILSGLTSNSDILNIDYELYFYDYQTSSYYESAINPTKLSDMSYTYQDVYYNKNSIDKSYLRLYFYDSPDETTQRLLGHLTIDPKFKILSLQQFVTERMVIPLTNPLYSSNVGTAGFFIYFFKDSVQKTSFTDLYMRATYFNAKNGKQTNFMTAPLPAPINTVLGQTYTKYRLIKTQTGYVYLIDTTYSQNISLYPYPPAPQPLTAYKIKLYERVVI